MVLLPKMNKPVYLDQLLTQKLCGVYGGITIQPLKKRLQQHIMQDTFRKEDGYEYYKFDSFWKIKRIQTIKPKPNDTISSFRATVKQIENDLILRLSKTGVCVNARKKNGEFLMTGGSGIYSLAPVSVYIMYY
jgi:hypothetical protein